MMKLIRGCYRRELFYTEQVRLKWNLRWLATLVAMAMGGAGCGGFSASKTVSPLDFFMPGLIQAAPPPTTDCTNLVATVR
jgi:hypothetical protein